MTKQEIETEIEKKPFEKEENQTLTFKGLLVRTDKEEKYVTQIRFKLSDDEDITYKPKKVEKELKKINGLSVSKEFSQALTIEELPRKIHFLNDLLNENGKIKVFLSYTVMNSRDRDDTPVSYKFITDKDFWQLYPMDKDNKEIVDKEVETK